MYSSHPFLFLSEYRYHYPAEILLITTKMLKIYSLSFLVVDLINTRLFFGLAGKFFLTLSYDVIYTWTVELYPTQIRWVFLIVHLFLVVIVLLVVVIAVVFVVDDVATSCFSFVLGGFVVAFHSLCLINCTML